MNGERPLCWWGRDLTQTRAVKAIDAVPIRLLWLAYAQPASRSNPDFGQALLLRGKQALLRSVTMALCLALALALAVPAAAEEPLNLRVVSGFMGRPQFDAVEQPFWLREVPALTGGRATVTLQTGSSLGITAEQMLTVIRNGVVSFGTLEVGSLTLSVPEFGVADLPLLAEDEAGQHRTAELWRPWLAAHLRERYGIELLAMFVRPPQLMFCNHPFASLLDLAGRRIRVASVNQSDLILALGAVPVVLELDRTVDGFRRAELDCAVVGALPASMVGLTRVTGHVSTVPIGWPMAFLTAHGDRWATLPEAVRAPLRDGIRRLEDRMRRAAKTLRDEGEACLSGRPGCPAESSRMQRVGESAASRAAIRALFTSAVLPGWVHRCGAACAESWNEVAAPVLGISAEK
ncbi:TRAP transporter substrate-binding protein DctP [Belnapia sp. T6]|uniref:TRAP transporter substrate-binding protein DctP n=1 Tax=Belnapia mucosa TaxID=2804532 RepID=A0ABS1VCY9_9PROT|nr:TRAP transporter substrate-binding protein DctP [Belnapia mucosa]MBL6459570.1 TRAP transporter substrate-binding protein DctP [Belnapia mucosa]